jgi:hypothetical protein
MPHVNRRGVAAIPRKAEWVYSMSLASDLRLDFIESFGSQRLWFYEAGRFSELAHRILSSVDIQKGTGEGWKVYFIYIRNEPQSFLKIGISKEVNTRRRQLAANLPFLSKDVVLLRTFTATSLEHAEFLETAFIEAFMDHNIKGEWFMASDEMADDIAGKVISAPPLPPVQYRGVSEVHRPDQWLREELTMPLLPGTSQATISKNIREFHTGKTYTHTARKFGKTRAIKQAVAVALSEARKSGGMLARRKQS